MLARLRLGVPCALGRRGGLGLPPPRHAYRSQPPRPTAPTPSTHKVDNLTSSAFQFCQFLNKKSRHDTSFVPAIACQVLKGKESDLRSNFPMTSLSARAVSGTIADYITLLRSLRNLSNESKGPLNTANQSDPFIVF